METEPIKPFELVNKLRFIGPTVLRVTVSGTDFTFVPGETYENLPPSEYLFALWKQDYFRENELVDGKPVRVNKNLTPKP